MRERPTVGGSLRSQPGGDRRARARRGGAGSRRPAARRGDRLRGLGVEVLELPNISLAELLGSIEALGRVVERPEAAAARTGAIREAWASAERAAAGRPRPRTVLVLQRDPLYLVGRGSFLDAMLRAAGAVNLGAGFDEAYPRASLEWLLAERRRR